MTEEVTEEVVREVMEAMDWKEAEAMEAMEEGAWLTVEAPGMEGWRGDRGEF